MPERFAIYFAPATETQFWARGSAWLGHTSGGAPAGLGPKRFAEITAPARHYGFHATLKAPMALARGRSRVELERALAEFAAEHPPVPLGRLQPTLFGGFLALMPRTQPRPLTELAGACVAAFDDFRAPLGARERDRRLRQGLSARQIALLEQYGYPYVLDEFIFHMTLTDRLEAAEQGVVKAAAECWFAPALEADIVLDRLCLFHQAEAGAPFTRQADFPLRARQDNG